MLNTIEITWNVSVLCIFQGWYTPETYYCSQENKLKIKYKLTNIILILQYQLKSYFFEFRFRRINQSKYSKI